VNVCHRVNVMSSADSVICHHKLLTYGRWRQQRLFVAFLTNRNSVILFTGYLSMIWSCAGVIRNIHSVHRCHVCRGCSVHCVISCGVARHAQVSSGLICVFVSMPWMCCAPYCSLSCCCHYQYSHAHFLRHAVIVK
jgi:hypothetical protein